VLRVGLGDPPFSSHGRRRWSSVLLSWRPGGPGGAWPGWTHRWLAGASPVRLRPPPSRLLTGDVRVRPPGRRRTVLFLFWLILSWGRLLRNCSVPGWRGARFPPLWSS